MPHTAHPASRWIACGAVVVSFVLFSLISHYQWTTFWVPSWDLGIFSQLARAYASFSEPIVPIKGAGFNLLGDHFHPILVLLGPIWFVWPSGLALLLTQNALFAAAAYPLTRLAVERLGTLWGSAAAVSYALSWGLTSAVISQFHEIAFAVPLLAFGLAAYLRGRWLQFALLTGLLVFVKEDLGLTVALAGAILALRPGHNAATRRKIGWSLAAWGAAWFMLATWVILPALNVNDVYDYASRVGHPLSVLGPPIKWLTAFLLAATAGFAGLRSPLALLVLPTMAWRFLGNVPAYWDWNWHYSAILMPILAAALLDRFPAAGAPEAGGQAEEPTDAAEPAGQDAKGTEAGSGAAKQPTGASGPLTKGARTKGGPLRFAVAVSLLTTLAINLLVLDRFLLRYDLALPPADRDHLTAIIERIEPGSRVLAGIRPLAYLTPKAEVYWYGNKGNPIPDYHVVDYRIDGNISPSNPQEYAQQQWGVRFTQVYQGGGFALLKRAG